MKYQVLQLYLPPRRASVYSYYPGLRVMLPDATSAALANQWLAWFKQHYELPPESEAIAASVGHPGPLYKSIVLMFQKAGTGPWQQIYMSPITQDPGAAPSIHEMANVYVQAPEGPYDGIHQGEPQGGALTTFPGPDPFTPSPYG